MLLSWSFGPSLARRISDKSGIQHKNWRSAAVDAGVTDRLSTTLKLWMSGHVVGGDPGQNRHEAAGPEIELFLYVSVFVSTRLQRAATTLERERNIVI